MRVCVCMYVFMLDTGSINSCNTHYTVFPIIGTDAYYLFAIFASLIGVDSSRIEKRNNRQRERIITYYETL